MSEPTETTQGAPEGDVQPTNGSGGVPDAGKTFDAAYVAKLRDEAAANRVAKASAEERSALAVDQLLRAMIELATAGVLRDPSDLPDGEYLGEDGMPSADKIREAAEKLATEKPHLATPRVPAAQLQGPAGQPEQSVSLGSLLRGAAQ